MSDRKKAFWFIALLSVLVVVPFLGETIFYSKGDLGTGYTGMGSSLPMRLCRMM